MIKSILLPVDGSVYTDAQVKYAMRFARACGSRLKAISIVDIRYFEWAHVMSTDGFVPVFPSTLYQEELQKLIESKAQAVLDKCAEMFAKEGMDFELERISGPPVDVICEKAVLADLIIMGARGEFAKWRRRMVGATLDAVVRQCNKPILITTQEYQDISRILFAYDGSDKANKAMQLAGFCASKLAVPLAILSVHDKDAFRNKYLEEAKAYLDAYDIPLELVGTGGNPEKEIIRVAEEKKCGLIIMGAYGHSRIREAILGSTTDQVIRTTSTPVLLGK
ncbi:MAG: universal stress protein [Calditrichaeota bacterium]|nr:MAG: universal stress protein [Calditrichota bacterium]